MARSSLPLHPTDQRAIALVKGLGAEISVVEAVGERGSAPMAASQALSCGASRAVRIVEPALALADSHTTGFVFAATIHHLTVDLVLFSADADPEGLGDTPACIAHHMMALYLPGALDLRSTGSGAGTVEITVRNSGWIRRLAVPMNAVVGIAAGAPPTDQPLEDLPPAKHTSVEVFTLADFNIDPALVRRRDDLRGVIEPASRPLVTLQSAVSVGALLRPT